GAGGCSYAVLPCRPAEWEPTLSSAALGALLHGVLDQALPQLPPPQRRALEVALLLADPVGSQPEQRAVCVAFLAVIRQLSAAGAGGVGHRELPWVGYPGRARGGVRSPAGHPWGGRTPRVGPGSGGRAVRGGGRDGPGG